MGLGATSAFVAVAYVNPVGVGVKFVSLLVPANGVAIFDQATDLATGTVLSARAVSSGGPVAVLEVGSGDTGLTSVSVP
jgi:hypothetical protein